jgi:4-amino-4-deoxy-L-arabinose transferase-like glycosyltransferase
MADGSANSARSRSKLIGSGIGLVCAFGMFLLMAREAQLPHATLLGCGLLLGGLFGLWAALDILAAPNDAIALRTTPFYALPGEPIWFAPNRTVPLALLLLIGITALFGAARLPIAIGAALLLLLASALRRPALLMFVIASALYLPLLGGQGLWDPWETHYGEVTREILARDDWISLWWAQDRWFWSKPILIFWAEALVWSGSGVGFHADQHALHTDWVLRLPIYLMSVAGLMTVYAAIGRLWSKRAGVLCGVVLATMPYYAFLTHQAITDMPFVANMTVAMMLLALAFNEDPEQRVRTLRIGKLGFSLQHVVIGLVVAVLLPQILYLASRNIGWSGMFAWHRDSFMFGSAGNPDVPGNFGIHEEQPRVRALVLEPLGQALLFGAALVAIVWMLRRETRSQVLYMFGFYVFCALAFMAKGIPGFALPGLVAFFHLCATRRFSFLFEGKLHVAAGMLVVVALGMPWFIAMYVRHGEGFPDRILIHDHINRLTSGVHGDNGSIQYFIWQLGYGMFPWIGLAPAGLASWLGIGQARANDPAGRARRDTLCLMGLWFAVSFTLFSAMTTKFHHYIFPAVPPAAVLIGLLIDRMLPEAAFALAFGAMSRMAAALLAPLALVLGFAGLRGDVRGVIPAGLTSGAQARWIFQHPWPAPACYALIGLALAAFAYAVYAYRSSRDHDDGAGRLFGAAALGGALLAAFVGRDLAWTTKDPPPGSERLIHLFVYNYSRPWPDYLDYRAIFFGFAAVTVLLTAALAWRRLRPIAATGMLGLALGFCVFCLDVYMVDLTPHWTQAGLVDRYYAERKSAEEPLLAWQMNWKGENFYTGNRVNVFVELDNKALLEWIGKNPGRRVYLVLEHSRLDRLRHLLAPREIEALTTTRDCNKFVLARTTL